jgi:hypothetical protein
LFTRCMAWMATTVLPAPVGRTMVPRFPVVNYPHLKPWACVEHLAASLTPVAVPSCTQSPALTGRFPPGIWTDASRSAPGAMCGVFCSITPWIQRGLYKGEGNFGSGIPPIPPSLERKGVLGSA